MARDKSTTQTKPEQSDTPEIQALTNNDSGSTEVAGPGDLPTDNPAPSTAVVKTGRSKKGEVLVMMTPDEAKETSKQIKRDLTHAGQLLLEMRDREGWRALGYSGFVEWATAEIGKSSATVYRYLNTAQEARDAEKAQARLTSGMPVDPPVDTKPKRGRPKGSGLGVPRTPRTPEDDANDAEGQEIAARASALISGESVPKPSSNGKRQGQLLDSAYLWKPAIRELEMAERSLDTTERAVMSLTHEERDEYAGRIQAVADMLGRRVEKIRHIESQGTEWTDDLASAPIEYEVTPPEETTDPLESDVLVGPAE